MCGNLFNQFPMMDILFLGFCLFVVWFCFTITNPATRISLLLNLTNLASISAEKSLSLGDWVKRCTVHVLCVDRNYQIVI